jgi:Domain of unknown function (DUF4460)
MAPGTLNLVFGHSSKLCLSSSRACAVRMTQASNFSSKKRNFFGKSREPQDAVVLPEFHDLLRTLYRKSHPDLLRATHPEFAVVNDSSMQLLNGILSSIKKCNEYPPALIKSIPFHVRKGEKIEVFNLKIKTAGGDSQRALKTSFKDFFLACGITNVESGVDFAWGKNYFPTTETPEEKDEKSETN